MNAAKEIAKCGGLEKLSSFSFQDIKTVSGEGKGEADEMLRRKNLVTTKAVGLF